MGKLKNRQPLSSTLPTELLKKLKEYSNNSMIPISRIIEKAIEEYINKSTKK